MIIDAYATETVPTHEVRQQAQSALKAAGEPLAEVTYDALRKRLKEAENSADKLKEAIQMARQCIDADDVIGAHGILVAALEGSTK